MIETGPLYLHFQGNISVTWDSNSHIYLLDYELHINEPFVRMSSEPVFVLSHARCLCDWLCAVLYDNHDKVAIP